MTLRTHGERNLSQMAPGYGMADRVTMDSCLGPLGYGSNASLLLAH